MTSVWEECKGCCVYRKDDKCFDEIIPILGDEECPCRTCLIKMSCMTECETYKEYSNQCKL